MSSSSTFYGSNSNCCDVPKQIKSTSKRQQLMVSKKTGNKFHVQQTLDVQQRLIVVPLVEIDAPALVHEINEKILLSLKVWK